MMQVLCPQCGAPVSFQSTASVMAVCGACRSTLMKDAETVRRIGEVGDLLEDYSPICLGAAGTYERLRFTVVGRIQLRYEAGFWNEWFIAFDDGQTGWLSDASGQYAITHRRRAQSSKPKVPQFEAIKPGSVFKLEGQEYIAADIRTCAATSAEGELPFTFGQGWTARVADYRSVDAFLTLDYSDADTPEIYIGKAYDLAGMDAATLLTREQVLDQAGRVRGRISALACPNCGGTISIVAAMATQVVCPSCGSTVDCAGDTAVVIDASKRVDKLRGTLALGQTATITGAQYTVIGMLKCTDPDPEDGSTWIEYLLYAPKPGFLWLVETDEGWERVRVCDTWPVAAGQGMRYQGKVYRKQWDYTSRVDVALGAFNWRVQVGDKTLITDYEATQGSKLSSELAEQELGWSASQKVSGAEIAQWFNRPELARRGGSGGGSGKRVKYTNMALFGSIALWLMSGGAILSMIIGVIALWVPALVADRIEKGE